jgi:hypothetical protein
VKTLFFCLLCSSCPLYADTLYFETGGSVNGTVTYNNETFTLEAKFVNGPVQTLTYYIPRAQAKMISINSTTTNFGSSGQIDITYKNSTVKLLRPDKLESRNGSVSGYLIKIEESKIVFQESDSNKPIRERDRAEVLRIILAH